MDKDTLNYEIDKIIKIISAGGIVIFPTDTVYALSCDYSNLSTIKKLYDLKNRDYKKPCALLISNLKMIKNFINITKKQEEFIKIIHQQYEYTVTFIVNLKKNKNSLINSFINVNNKIAFRIPKHTLCYNIINNYGKPLLATSVNISGNKSVIYSNQLSKYFIDKVDYIIKEDENTLGIESMIIDITNNKLSFLRGNLSKISFFENKWNILN